MVKDYEGDVEYEDVLFVNIKLPDFGAELKNKSYRAIAQTFMIGLRRVVALYALPYHLTWSTLILTTVRLRTRIALGLKINNNSKDGDADYDEALEGEVSKVYSGFEAWAKRHGGRGMRDAAIQRSVKYVKDSLKDTGTHKDHISARGAGWPSDPCAGGLYCV